MTTPAEPPPSAAWAAPAANPPRAPWAPPGNVGPAVRPTVNGFAVASLVLGWFAVAALLGVAVAWFIYGLSNF